MVKDLTQKQKNFCYNIVSGMTGIDSYMSAYNSNNRNVANVESTKLLKRDDITEFLKEINKPILNHNQNIAISERKQQIEYIKQRIAICEAREDENSIIRYTDQLNKILNLYKESEPEKKEESTVNSLDMDTLIKLSGVS